MGWLPHQQLRLAQEQVVLKSHLPGFHFHDHTGSTYVAGTWESSKRITYDIRIYLPAGYPDECPSTYVVSPSPLRGYAKPIEEYGTSHAMHVWNSDRPGWVKICTMRPARWSAAYSLEKLARKAQLWITAYECHLDEGRPIAEFLLNEPE